MSLSINNAAAQSTSSSAATPDPTLVNDVLQGHHLIQEKDDISVLRVYQQGSDVTTGLLSFPTQNSNFTNPANPQKSEIVSAYGSHTAGIASGRMFNATNDDVVTMSAQNQPNNVNQWLMSFTDTLTGNNENFVIPNNKVTPPPLNTSETAASLIVMGNFVSNGVQQAVALYGTGPNNWGMNVLASSNPNQPPSYSSLALGPQFSDPSAFGAAPMFSHGSMVVGDFNNDGRDEIAVYMTANGQAYVQYFTVNPQTLAITPLTSV
ncbi:MAG: VCBS repeat-containing protein, partial [Acidobacteriaceae bacterium]|nr:VCBS repeat-containing protein [Acidobacteriaceae bacterium]